MDNQAHRTSKCLPTGHLPSACPWTAGHRLNHLLVCLVCFTACCSQVSWLLHIVCYLMLSVKGECCHAGMHTCCSHPALSHSATAASSHARSMHAMGSVAHLLQEQLTLVDPPRSTQAHCTSSCPLPAQGSRTGQLPSGMQRLSCQGSRAGHLLSPCLWTAGHRPNHVLV